MDALFVKALANNYELLLYDPDSLKTIFEYRLHEAKTGQLPAEVAGHISSYISSERTQRAVSFQPLKRKRLKHKILDSLFKPIYKRLECELSDVKKELSDVKKELSDVKKELSDVKNFEHESQFLKKVFYSDLSTNKKIFLLGTSEHDNVGDSAVTIGVYEFIRKYFSEYRFVEVTGYHMQMDFKYISSFMRDDDVIFLQGGGNLGNMYMAEEDIRRRVIESFPANKIFILPQTIWFSDDERGKAELDKSAKIYERHNGLVLFTRGKESLSLAKAYFPSIRCMNMIDMALMLSRDYAFDRKGILVCIRDLDDESGLDEKIYNKVFEIIRKTELNYQQTKNRYGKDILPLMAGEVVNNELMKYARSKIVVTDRLHGMLFFVITKTPCVVMGSYTHKIDEFSEFFADSNAVFFIEKDISKLQDTMAKAFLVTEPKYPILEKGLFDKMADYIRTTIDLPQNFEY
ncbi:hypothetical protein AGMMS49950_00270 [Endomicrobiia bacterium]|nr:hypothetical protein AGMMS49950_00120 [Endomicrobiia bacterium]GHT68796.1 hypothetical protein AGMMS49950_00270 [Endomicrobiia bacterium]